MSLTSDEIVGILLSNYDAPELLELLDISAEQLLERFDDIITREYDRLNEECLELPGWR